MHGLSLFSVWIGDAVCECVEVCGLGDFNFTVLFCELFVGCLMWLHICRGAHSALDCMFCLHHMDF